MKGNTHFNVFVLNVRVTKSKRMRWGRNVSRMGEITNNYTTVVGKHETKRSGTTLTDLGIKR
jgi:hypothetical protein